MSSSPSAARRRTRPATGPTSGASEPGDSVVGLGVDQVKPPGLRPPAPRPASSAHEAVEGRAGDAGDRREVTWSPCSMPAAALAAILVDGACELLTDWAGDVIDVEDASAAKLERGLAAAGTRTRPEILH